MRVAKPKFLAACAAAAALTAWSARAAAQDWFGIATYQVSIPTGDTDAFAGNASFLGAGLGLRRTLTGGTMAGVMLAWDVLHERTDRPLDLEFGTVSGSQDRYFNSFPIMLGLHQYFGNRRRSRVHVGVNAGGYLLVQSLRIGVAEVEEDAWEWGVAPEAGVALPLRTGAWFVVNGRYHWSPTPRGLSGDDFDLTYFQLNVGFMWEQ